MTPAPRLVCGRTANPQILAFVRRIPIGQPYLSGGYNPHRCWPVNALAVAVVSHPKLHPKSHSVRWCRQHLGERGVPEKLRKLELSLAALALALDYEMDGQRAKAVQALEKADWQYKPQSYFFDPHGWDH